MGEGVVHSTLLSHRFQEYIINLENIYSVYKFNEYNLVILPNKFIMRYYNISVE